MEEVIKNIINEITHLKKLQQESNEVCQCEYCKSAYQITISTLTETFFELVEEYKKEKIPVTEISGDIIINLDGTKNIENALKKLKDSLQKEVNTLKKLKYEKTNWVDQEVNEEGEITQEGTTFDAQKMNKIEDAIAALVDTVNQQAEKIAELESKLKE